MRVGLSFKIGSAELSFAVLCTIRTPAILLRLCLTMGKHKQGLKMKTCADLMEVECKGRNEAVNPYRGKIVRIRNDLKKRTAEYDAELASFRQTWVMKRAALEAALETINCYIESLHHYEYWPYFAKRLSAITSTLPPQDRAIASKVRPLMLNVEQFGAAPLTAFLNKAHPARGSGRARRSLAVRLKDAERKIEQAQRVLLRHRAETPSWLGRTRYEAKLRSLEADLARVSAERDLLARDCAAEKTSVSAATGFIRSYPGDWNKVLRRRDVVVKLKQQIDRELPFLDAHETAYAKAAATEDKTRDAAREISDIINKTRECPYCGMALGDKPHLDHIYPISKGGLSIRENLVWCCALCNLRKSDSGLIAFLHATGFDLATVFNRLKAMGKHV
jgi:hypothetical protein